METLRSPHVAGRRFRMHWMVQPGMQLVEEYVFHVDGSMSYGRADTRREFSTLKQYGALEVAPDVVLVSFMDNDGRTLSFAMNFSDRRAQGFSAMGANWTPIQGKFEEMSKDRAAASAEAATA